MTTGSSETKQREFRFESPRNGTKLRGTEVGPIPEKWSCVSLGEVADAFNGKGSRSGGSWLRVFKTKHVYDGNVRRSQPEFVPDQLSPFVPESTYLQLGDVLTPNTAHATIGRVSFVPSVDEPSVCDGQVMVIRTRDPKRLNSRFLYEFLSSHAGRQQILQREVGSIFGPARGQTHLYPEDVLTISVPLPSPFEQEAIAEALSDADALIESLEQLIAKKRLIEQGVMRELLSGKRRLPGFEGASERSQTDAGSIPVDWVVDAVKNHVHIATGGRNTQDRVADGLYPFFVRSQTVERINSFSFDGEAVLTAGDGVGTGKIFHYIDGRFDVHQRVYRMTEFSERLDGYFFYLYFSSRFYERIMKMTAKSSVDSVRMEMIAEMHLVLPPIEEQRAIARVLTDMRAEIEALDAKLEKARMIKQGMMHNLLTGKIRLV